MDYAALKAELTAGHPVTGAYSANNATAAVEINVINQTAQRLSMSGDEVFNSTDNVEFAGLSAEKRSLWMSFCGRETIDPFATANVDLVQWLFGGGFDTITELAILRITAVSRAEKLRLGTVNEGHIAEARRI